MNFIKWLAFVLLIVILSYQLKDNPRRSLWNSGSPITVEEVK